MKRNVKFYRRDRSVKFRGKRTRSRNGKYKNCKQQWFACIYFPFTGKERRTAEKRQILEYLKEGDEDVFRPIKGGMNDWD